MVNSQVTREVSNAFKLDERVDKFPSVMPVIEVGLKGSKSPTILRSAWASNATSTIVYTTPTDQDFYLIFASLHHQGEAAAGQSTQISLSCVVNSVRQNILGFQNIANTNSSSRSPGVFQSDRHPIKIDRGSTITIVHNQTATQDRTFASIVGYIDEIS